MGPAAVMLWPSSTAANDTLRSRGIPIDGRPVGGTGVGNGADPTVNVGDLNSDLHLGASPFTPVPSLASGSPPLLPPDTGPVQESLPIATGGSRQEGLTPPSPVAPLPGFETPQNPAAGVVLSTPQANGSLIPTALTSESGEGKRVGAVGEAASNGEAVPATAPRELQFSTVQEFNEAARNPLPNATYHSVTYVWATDERGRSNQISGIAEVKSSGRNTSLQVRIGKTGKATDVGFHLIADSLNGPTNPLNVVPGNGKPIGDGLPNLNQGAFARFERIVRDRAISSGKPLEVEIRPIYDAGNTTFRPDRISAKFRPEGEDWTVRVFQNR